MLTKWLWVSCVALGLALPAGVHAYMAGVACSAGQVSGPDANGDNLICSGGVFVVAGASGSTSDRIVSGTSTLSINGNGNVSLSSAGLAALNVVPASTSNASIEVGTWRTGNGYSFIDLVGDTTYADYGFRILRDNTGANAPTWITHRGTGTLGIWTYEAAPIAFATSNTERMRLTAAGLVGIGTTTPAATLQVSGSFIVSNTIGNAAPALYVSGTTGRVGIGTSAPNAPLSFGTALDAQKVLLYDASLVRYGFGIQSNEMRRFVASNASVGHTWGVISNSDGTTYTERVRLTASGNLGIGTTDPSKTLHLIGGTDAALANHGYLVIGPTNSTNTVFDNNEIMARNNGATSPLYLQADGGDLIIGHLSTGNVGIGTSAPSSTLHVLSSAFTVATFERTPAAAGGAAIAIKNSAGATYMMGLGASAGDFGIYPSTGSFGEHLTIKASNGNVGIGTTGPAARLDVVSSTAGVAVARFQNGTGACTFTPASSGAGTWSCSSDARLKKDITDAQSTLAWLDSFRIRDFTMKSDGSRQTGVIAQEMLKTHPEMVKTDADGFYMVDGPGVWKLVKAMQELRAENARLERRASETAGVVTDLRGVVEAQAKTVTDLQHELAAKGRAVTDLQRAVADMQKQMKAANDNGQPRAKAIGQ